MRRLYRQWMHDWETRLADRDTNRVVRPFEWGLEWTQSWPLADGQSSAADAASFMRDLNRRIVEESDRFFSYTTPSDFRLEEDRLRFTSPVATPYPENNVALARWFPAAKYAKNGRKSSAEDPRAVVVLPQWNADAESHVGLCRLFNWIGISALRLSLPYHDVRKPAEIARADYAVSSNIARTIDAARQAVIDARCCLDWLENQGYRRLGIVGTSLGSCYAYLASAHDPRLRVNAFNHASTAFGDVVWAGQSTRHIRQALEDAGLTQERLRALWSAISPVSYFERFRGPEANGPGKNALVVYANYDLTFPRQYSLQVADAFRRSGLRHEVHMLPCGHYTTGETPFKFLDGWYMGWFVYRAFKSLRDEKSAALVKQSSLQDSKEAQLERTAP